MRDSLPVTVFYPILVWFCGNKIGEVGGRPMFDFKQIWTFGIGWKWLLMAFCVVCVSLMCCGVSKEHNKRLHVSIFV